MNSSVTSYCWDKYGWLLEKTIDWFRKMGFRYRGKPWRQEFLYKYSKGMGLDLGCGLASTTKHLLRSGFLEKLYLLDIVEETLLETCRDDYRVVCVVGDILSPPFRDNVFDTVYLLAVIHHIPGRICRLQVLREAYRMVKPGGYVLVTAWTPEPSLLNGLKVIGENEIILTDKHGERYYYLYSVNRLIKDLEEAGFKVIDHGIFIQNLEKPRITRNVYVVGTRSI